EQLLARATAIIGDEIASPGIDNPGAGSTATPFGTPGDGVGNGSEQLLAFFSFDGFEGVQRYSYSVFHNNNRIYQSPVLTWEYGDNGRTWVGYYDPAGPITSGTWEVEIYADGTLLGTVPVDVP